MNNIFEDTLKWSNEDDLIFQNKNEKGDLYDSFYRIVYPAHSQHTFAKNNIKTEHHLSNCSIDCDKDIDVSPNTLYIKKI